MPGTLVGISSRTVSQRAEIIGTTPEIRLTETDQTDPAGRYRLGVSVDSFFIERSGAAGWINGLGAAANFVFFQYDRTNTSLLLNPYESNAWNVRLLAGAAATPGTNANFVVQAHATTPSIDLQTGNGAGAALVSRFLVGGGAGTPDIDIASARMDFNGNAVAGLAVVRGNGTANVQFLANKVATDATARNFEFLLLDPATDAETLLLQLTANGLTPSLDLQDDLLLRIGTTGDTGIANISAGLTANTASAGTLEGTVVNPIALAANSLVIGNIANDGDILIAVSKAGNSYMAFMADGSTGDTLLGAPTGQSADVYIAGVKVLDIAANLLTYEAAASTSNQRLLVSNTSNAAAASHAIIEAAVGGTTSTGDPQVRLTIPSGTSWYMGVDNSGVDNFAIGTGTTIGSAYWVRIDPRTSTGGAHALIDFSTPAAISFSDGATNALSLVRVSSATITQAGTTQVTALNQLLNVQTLTINQSGGAVTVNKATGTASVSVTAGASVTLTHSSAYRALTGGAAVNVSGLFLEAQTAGTTGNYGIFLDAENATGDIGAISLGVERAIRHNIVVGAGGAANAQLSQQFQLDSVFEAGLSGETDGAGGVTAATQVWKVPYRDSGVNVAAPAALNVEVLGGLRVEAGDDTNRIYFRANAAWHYINQTAGLSITKEERYDAVLGRNWEVGDLALVKMHQAYGDGGADFLPYPLEEGLRKTLLRLLDVDGEFRQQVRERLEVK